MKSKNLLPNERLFQIATGRDRTTDYDRTRCAITSRGDWISSMGYGRYWRFGEHCNTSRGQGRNNRDRADSRWGENVLGRSKTPDGICLPNRDPATRKCDGESRGGWNANPRSRSGSILHEAVTQLVAYESARQYNLRGRNAIRISIRSPYFDVQRRI